MNPTRRIALAPAATKDMRQALRATLQLWGRDQRVIYEKRLRETINSLLDFPERGVLMNEAGVDIRAVPCGQHKIYYRIDGNVVRVIRVLHVRMDIPGQFDSPLD